MAKQDESAEIARLEQINGELTQSLERCRSLLAEARSQLAANGNEQFEDEEPPAIRTDRPGRSADRA
ncbi:MAG TPA: hypothetical protein VM265_04120 [Sphingomicrobium sp.]|nr:hypothetical protein [Sphingomicrobium sp.]